MNDLIDIIRSNYTLTEDSYEVIENSINSFDELTNDISISYVPVFCARLLYEIEQYATVTSLNTDWKTLTYKVPAIRVTDDIASLDVEFVLMDLIINDFITKYKNTKHMT